MKIRILLMVLVLSAYACTSNKNEEIVVPTSNSNVIEVPLQNAETVEMVQRLTDIEQNGDPKDYLYWNKKKAALLALELDKPETPYHGQLWYEYCNQLLRSGDSRECIKELESNFDRNQSLGSQMNNENYLLFELLALANLRVGEQENCQNLHTEFSCILPLEEPAFHQLPEGSTRAINLYQQMYDRYPKANYKWLINLAYMTLGSYPDGVPKKYFIAYPNWKIEQKNFPRFKEIAMNVNAAISGLSGGICLEDFNQDGLIDIFATDYDSQGQPKLLINNGTGAFVDKTISAGLQGLTGGLNCIHADYNNDGFTDILILRGAWLGGVGNHPNSLLKNNGDGTFSDVTKSAGILSLHPTQTAAWVDYNRDGFLDLFIGNESSETQNACEMYENNGNGTFTEVAEKCKLNNIFKFVKGVTWGDINNDNWPDLFISCAGKNLLFKNNEGIFEDISITAGIENPEASFATWFWDVNNDGYQDLFVAGYDTKAFDGVANAFASELEGLKTELSKPAIYINNGNETFTNSTKKYKLDKSIFAMGANFGDLNNDGFLDFYLGTGSPEFDAVVPNRMFLNKGGKYFEEVTSAGGFGHIQKGHGIAFADIDQDGDQDIYAVMGGAFQGDGFTNVLFENPGFNNNWITIDLQGVSTNRSAIGTRIEILTDNNQKIYHTVGTGGSFGSSSLQAEIGLGAAKSIKKLTVYWQNSETTTFENVPVNQKIHITEGEKKYQPVTFKYIAFAKGTGSHHHH